jgi:uncharacterized protein
MSEKTNIVFIGGGDSFASNEEFYTALRSWSYDPYKPERKRWRDALALELVSTHELIGPVMPNKQNADYTAWSIWFEKVIPFLRDDDVLIGHSLGGGFLLRYLTEHQLPIRIAQLHLISPVVVAGESSALKEFSIDPLVWSGFQSQIREVHVWHSTDDTIVPISESQKFKEVYPAAALHTFADRGHFLMSEFPEIVTCIKENSVRA